MLRRHIAMTMMLWGMLGSVTVTGAQEVTLKLHQMLPPQSTIPSLALAPWAQKVEQESGGRIKVDHYPSMQLGGSPPNLYDQVRDGVVDLTWTLPGYTPGRFPKTEAFELPFMMTDAEATSKAFQEFFDRHVRDEFQDVHVIAVHVHGPGIIHMKDGPITRLEDLQGRSLRGPTRVINQMLSAFGATPVGMPVPAVPEALSKGVIDGTVIPWEVSVPLKVSELVDGHTAFSGAHGLYTATFVFAMNRQRYESLPPDLKAIIDRNSGIETAALFGRAMDQGDAQGLKVATASGNQIVTLDEAETARWKEAAAPVIAAWIEEMNGRGEDGQALVDEARALIEQYSEDD